MDKGLVIWYTGLSASGKTTSGDLLQEDLKAFGIDAIRLDGDIVRSGVCKDLTFTMEDRWKNLERASHIAELLRKQGFLVICTFITPYEETRKWIRRNHEKFFLIYLKCPLEVCEKRDVKGLYKKARTGEIQHFTGISDAFEEPKNADFILDTDKNTIEQCREKLLNKIWEIILKKVLNMRK